MASVNRRRCWFLALPETFCLWAGEPQDLACCNTKHLAGQIRGG